MYGLSFCAFGGRGTGCVCLRSVCVGACVHMFTCVYVCVHVSVCMSVRVCVRMHVYVYVCVDACVYLYVNIFTHTWKSGHMCID